MHRRIYIIVSLFLILVIFFGVFASRMLMPKQLSTEQKLQDFEYMYGILKESYPYFEVKKRMTGYDWLAHKSEYERWIRESKNDIEYYRALDRIVNLLQSGHTHLLDSYNYDYFKKVYADPHSAYSPSRRNILNKAVAAERYKSWDDALATDESYIPILFKYIDGSYVVVDGNLDNYNIPKGSILKTVENLDIDEYIKSLSDKMYLEYDYKRLKQKVGTLIIYPRGKASLKLSFEAPDGQTIEKQVFKGVFENHVFGNPEEDKNYKTEILIQNKIAYIRLSSMEAVDRFASQKDGEEIRKFVESIKGYPYLIVDIRGNTGGDSGYWRNNLVAYFLKKSVSIDSYVAYRKSDYLKPFMQDRFTEEPKPTAKLPANTSYPPELNKDFGYFYTMSNIVVPDNPIDFSGKIYLLVDNDVYSAAEGFASYAKAINWATLVGTTTGGDGIGVDAAFLALPNSGFVVRFASDMGINPDGTANEETHTQPDIYIEQNYSDYVKYLQEKKDNEELIMSKYDTVLNYTLKLIENTSQIAH